MVVTKESCDKLVGKIAHEVAKTKTKNNKLAADDEEVITIKKDMCACIKSHKKPDVKATVRITCFIHSMIFMKYSLNKYFFQVLRLYRVFNSIQTVLNTA